jgi:hypothetical protein
MKNPLLFLFGEKKNKHRSYLPPEDLLKELISRCTRPEQIVHGVPDDKFKEVVTQIQEGIKFLEPATGFKQNAHTVSMLISNILHQHGIAQNIWWNEVWYRGGCKNCMEYNKRVQ